MSTSGSSLSSTPVSVVTTTDAPTTPNTPNTPAPVYTLKGALSVAPDDPRMSFFFKIVRNTPGETLTDLLEKSWSVDPLDTLKLIFHLRDCRGGKGEKKQFHDCLQWLLQHHPEILSKNLDNIPFFGSYKDWLTLLGSAAEMEMIQHFTVQLRQDKQLLESADEKVRNTITLAAKWAPTEGCAHDRKSKAAAKFASALQVRKEAYRRNYLVPLRNHLRIVEAKMCKGDWSDIDFSHVPAVALKRYKKAFAKHAPEKYQEFLARVKAGQAKMNVGRLHPHEILAPYIRRGATKDETIEAQWQTYVAEHRKKLVGFPNSLAMIDVSGSMSGQPLEVAVSLGLLIAECNVGAFHDKFLTFSSNPSLEELRGDSTHEKVRNVRHSHWEMSTNLQAAFDLILATAKMFKVPPEQMPAMLIVLSDMAFDSACGRNDKTNFQVIEEKYRAAGYTRPKIVFWNLQGTSIDFPVASNVPDCALVSGFSGDLLTLFLECGEMTPYLVMRKAIDAERYNRVVV
jgi:hypothetical protein